MVIKFVEARCLNCGTEVKQEQDTCTKCGDPVAVRPPGRKPFFEQAADVREVLEQANGTALTVQLSEEQDKAIEAIRGWWMNAQSGIASFRTTEPFRLFGPAGTGKTTLAKHLAAALGTQDIAFGAYTGKAAHVLRRKGVDATTIHSALYTPSNNRELRRHLLDLRMELIGLSDLDASPVENGRAWQARKEELEAQIEQAEKELRKPVFEFNPGSEWGYADLIVLDEVSMVNTKIAEDIERLGVPVLVLGDPFQLPPIDGGGHYTNAEPDVLLTEVHRQALESPVLHLATDVRLGMPWHSSLVKVDLAEAMAADQVLVWKNSTRWSLIERMRAKRGYPAGVPTGGDRIMCLVNNKDAAVLNGQQFTVTSVGRDRSELLEIRATDDEGQARELLAHPEGFQGLAKEKEAKDTFRAFRGEVGLFTFADAITVHKAQGSEWPHVYVVDQTHQMTRETRQGKARWLYTAATRASDRVTLASTQVK
jgi:exodeoxyribonuclease-5